MAGIYIHIPFCKQACYYCDFHFSTNTTSMTAMVDAITKEIALQKEYLDNEPIETIYFGGGTPSLLDQQAVEKIITSITDNFDVIDFPEITLEANPDDLTKSKLDALRNAGVNRLSIGVQSFDDAHLKFLNRAHNSPEATNCITYAQEIGINNISIDLIYAIPSNNHDKWKADLHTALDLGVPHISSYCLTIEEKTVFGNWLKKGQISSIDDEYAAQQFEILLETLTDNGYEQYEISNFAKPEMYSKHNSSYWKQKKYLGVGPSAHSYNGKNRQYNISHNKKYLDALAKDVTPYELDLLDIKDHVNEYLLTTLRTKWGADLDYLKTKYKHDLTSVQHQYLSDLLKRNHAVIEKQHLILTDQGKLFADKIASDLFLV